MENKDDLIGKVFPQKCGDSFVVLEKINFIKGKGILYKCKFLKYPYTFYETKSRILSITFDNPLIEQIEFINKEWPVNNEEFILIFNKTKNKDKSGHFLFECNYKKYPLKKNFFCTKSIILRGGPYSNIAERKFLMSKFWIQNEGDYIKVLGKDKRGLLVCEFQKYPYIKKANKKDVIEGKVKNPNLSVYKNKLLKNFKIWKQKNIEIQDSFYKKEWKQNCGDILKIKESIGKGYYKCIFTKYPYEIIAYKSNIIRGTVNNPKIEQIEFIEKIWPQSCGDSLKILKKSNKQTKQKEFLWEVEFINYPFKTLETKIHIKKGSVVNYNLPFENKDALTKWINEKFNGKVSLRDLAESLNCAISSIGQKISKFGLEQYIDYKVITSYIEDDIRVFCLKLNKNFLQKSTWNELNGQEIDIYNPNLKFGIELNGNYWHSELYKKSDYHQNKSLLAKEKGIDLIHIFEYEWLEKEEIIKSLIKSKLGIFNKKVGARKCIIRELDNNLYEDFCIKNHLQGSCGAKVKLGLFYKDKLIQVMSFGVPRFTENFEWEILRECSKQNYFILGGKEKLWNYFIKKFSPKNCISYCDFSKFTGDSYLKLGFKKERLNKPGFVWFNKKTNETFWRNPYKNQEMKEKGYLKIYDCGQLVFTWFNIS